MMTTQMKLKKMRTNNIITATKTANEKELKEQELIDQDEVNNIISDVREDTNTAIHEEEDQRDEPEPDE
jgi:hypothetical protein